MRLQLLGELKLVDDAGASVELKGRKCRALLAYLALHPRHSDTRERLSALLWGDMGDERARANLRQSLSSLRETLHDEKGEQIVSTEGGVRLEGPLLDSDAAQLKRLAASADSKDWERAARLVSGELLADLVVDEESFDEWLTAERRAMKQLVCTLWSKLSQARREKDDAAGSEGALLCWLTVEPTAEEAHRALMDLYAATGRRTKALMQFTRCADALEQLLQAKPEAATVMLQQRIHASPVPVAPTLSLPSRPSVAVVPFVADEAWLGDGFAEDVVTALSSSIG